MLGKIESVTDDLYRPLDDDTLDDALDIMAEIREFAQEHFGIEEGYMKEVDYPGLEDHKAAHDKLLDHIIRTGRRAAQRLVRPAHQNPHVPDRYLPPAHPFNGQTVR